MGEDAERLLGEVLELPSAEQVEVFERLGARLQAGRAGPLSDAWRSEILKRIACYDADEDESIPVEDLERELWAEQLADEQAAAIR